MKDDAVLLSWAPRQLFQASLLIAGMFAAFYMAYLCLDLVLLLLFAVLLATILEKPIQWLLKLHFSKIVAVPAVHGLLVIALVAAAMYLVPLVLEQSQNVATVTQEKYDALRGKMERSDATFLRHFSENLPKEPKSFLRQKSETAATENITNAWLIVRGTLEKLLSAYAVLMLSV
jgi:predicted PurR-regulated permease PerM